MRMACRVVVVVGVVCLLGSARASADEPAPCFGAMVRANIETSRELVRIMRRLSERSPTFKTQCDRIAAAPYLHVRIAIDAHMPRYCRAFTVVQRIGRQLRAEVHLPPSADQSELIAHEFEHLLEQIEGLDLRQLSRVRGSGVREIEPELFESERAQAAGRVVAAESRRRVTPAAD